MKKESTINILDQINEVYDIQKDYNCFNKESFVNFWKGYVFCAYDLGYINYLEKSDLILYLTYEIK